MFNRGNLIAVTMTPSDRWIIALQKQTIH